MQAVRTRIFDIFVVLTGIFFYIPQLWHRMVPRGHQIRRTTRIWARVGLWGLRRIIGLGYRVERKGPLVSGPKLLIANHQSWWETIAFLAVEPDCAIVARSTLVRIPVIGWYMQRSPHILIDREMSLASVRQICREGKDAVANGRSIVLFPEATRKPVYAPLDIKRSVYLIYKELGIPAVPVVHNSGAFLWSGYRTKYPGTVTLEYHPQIPPGAPRDDFLAALNEVIGAAKDRLVDDLGDGFAEREAYPRPPGT